MQAPKAQSKPVPLAELENTIWYTKKTPSVPGQENGYTLYTFSDGEGTCVEKGLETFTFYFDDAKGYYVASADEQRDLSLGMFFTSESRVSGIETPEGKVTCTALPKLGENTVPFTCVLDMQEEEYCTGTYQGTAQK